MQRVSALDAKLAALRGKERALARGQRPGSEERKGEGTQRPSGKEKEETDSGAGGKEVEGRSDGLSPRGTDAVWKSGGPKVVTRFDSKLTTEQAQRVALLMGDTEVVRKKVEEGSVDATQADLLVRIEDIGAEELQEAELKQLRDLDAKLEVGGSPPSCPPPPPPLFSSVWCIDPMSWSRNWWKMTRRPRLHETRLQTRCA